MNIQELSQKMEQLVRSKGWYEETSRRPQTPRNIAISLSLESSEVLEHFQWNEEPEDKEELADEMADVALYLLQLANITKIDLEQAILSKIQKNYKRTWDVPTSSTNR
jgi:8-oxo-dGTP diphosphatase